MYMKFLHVFQPTVSLRPTKEAETQSNMSGSIQRPSRSHPLDPCPSAPRGHDCTLEAPNFVCSHHTPDAKLRGHPSYTSAYKKNIYTILDLI